MRAQLVIEHRPGDLLSSLKADFGEHDANAKDNSAFAQKSPESVKAIQYTGVRPDFVVLAWSTEGQVFLYVESSSGRLRTNAEEVWDIVRKGRHNLGPRLKSLVLFDEDSNDTVVRARVGAVANLRRRELVFTFATGLGSVAWLAVALTAFDATGDLVLGAVPALLAAILALLTWIADVRSKRLVWE